MPSNRKENLDKIVSMITTGQFNNKNPIKNDTMSKPYEETNIDLFKFSEEENIYGIKPFDGINSDIPTENVDSCITLKNISFTDSYDGLV